MPGEPLGVALIGAGRMGTVHIDSLADSASVSVVVVADASPAALDAVRERHPGADTCDSVDVALEHPAVEACLVATSTPSHPDIVRRAVGAGLHILCEKPLALDPREARALGELADEAGVVLQVGFWRRFSPPWKKAREAIEAGTIGRPLLVRLSQWDADPPPPDFCDPSVSGGLAIDCGVHEFDLAEWLTGSTVTEISAWTLPTVDQGVAAAGDIDNLVAVLKLDDGAAATVDLSRNCRYGDDVRTEVLGSAGALFIDLLPTGRTRVATSDGVSVLAGSEVDDATVAGVIGQAEALAAAVRNGGLELPGAEASARATEIAMMVNEATRSGEAIRLGH
jgi:myo-inositol 2-dehydrogenase/D-chiro-inositol 1-dehydrogenase